jgi:hypothetical protein
MSESQSSVEFSCLECGQRAKVHKVAPKHLLTILGGLPGEVCRHGLKGQGISACPSMQEAERQALQLLNVGVGAIEAMPINLLVPTRNQIRWVGFPPQVRSPAMGTPDVGLAKGQRPVGGVGRCPFFI